jgi:Ran GTPase-activating protein (RanGAP) involved in mRNA processing and transport
MLHAKPSMLAAEPAHAALASGPAQPLSDGNAAAASNARHAAAQQQAQYEHADGTAPLRICVQPVPFPPQGPQQLQLSRVSNAKSGIQLGHQPETGHLVEPASVSSVQHNQAGRQSLSGHSLLSVGGSSVQQTQGQQSPSGHSLASSGSFPQPLSGHGFGGSAHLGRPSWSQVWSDGNIQTISQPRAEDYAPLLSLLDHYKVSMLPNDLQFYARKGSLDGLERVVFQPHASAIPASQSRSGAAIVLAEEDLTKLAVHLPKVASLKSVDFIQCTFPAMGFNYFVTHMMSLQRLCVYACGINAAVFCSLLKVLPEGLLALDAGGNDLSRLYKSTSTLSRILSGGRSSSDAAGACDSNGLLRLTGLQQLHLQRACISGLAMEILAQHIQCLPHLQVVNFCHNPLGKTGIRALGNALAKSNAPISSLHLGSIKSNSGSLTDGLQVFVNAISSQLTNTLKVLNLSGNCIDNHGCSMLASWLFTTPLLESLNMSRNNFAHKGVTSLTAALTNAHNLRELNIGHNEISALGIKAALAAIAPHTSLQMLDVEACGMTGFAVPELVNQLPHMSSLRVLNLSYNTFADEGIKLLVPVLLQCPSLEKLYVASTGLTFGGLSVLVPALRQMAGLKVADVRHNAPGQAGSALLAKLTEMRIDMDVRQW